jgi:quercetin dioxygenase-like cupin family protein
MITIPAADDGWAELLPKVHAKLVYTDGTAQSYLVRLEPGARAPAHDHPGDEECVVLEGEVRYLGGSTLRAGDYECAPRGAHHTDLVSETGALVFLRYARPLGEYVRL